MRKYLVLALAVLLVFGLGSVALAVNTAEQEVTITVNEIMEIAVSDNPGALIIDTATAGAPPTADLDDSTYALYTSVVSTDETRTITAAIDAIPAGLELKLEAAPPTDCGTTAGAVALTTTAASIIENIGSCATGTETGANLTYTLSVTDVTKLVADTTNVTVTLTLTDAAA